MSLLLALIVTFASMGTVDTTTDDFENSEQAMAVLEELLITDPRGPRPTVEQMRERTELLRAWLVRAEELDLDFGPRNYVVDFARYASAGFGRDPEVVDQRLMAADAFIDAAMIPGRVRDGADLWSGWIGRMSSFAFTREFAAEDWDRTGTALIGMVVHSRDPKVSIQQVMKKMAEADSIGTARLRTALAVAVARCDRIPMKDKEQYFVRLYGDAPVEQVKKNVTPVFQPFDGPLLGGGTVSVADFKGKVLLIDYWATWCGPCLREMPNVVEAWRKHKDDGLAILGVSLDRANADEKLRTTMAKYGMDWPQIYEGTGWQTKPARLNGVRSIPATFLLDREGNVIATNLRGAALERAIAKALAAPTSAPGGSVEQ